jgi:hypothetical protein
VRWLRSTAIAFGMVLALAAPAAAQSSVLLEDDLTEPGESFSEDSGGDIAVFEFGRGGMTVAAVNKERGLYLAPASLPESDALLNAALEVNVTAGNKKTTFGAFCRRSDANGGFLFVVDGKRYGLYARDDLNQLERLESGKIKNVKPRKPTDIRAECARQSAQGFSVILTLSVNGKEVVSRLVDGAPNLGRMGLYLEGVDGGAGVATFTDLEVEELPAP